MISALGFLATGNEELADALRRTLVALATNQTPLSHIPSVAHDPVHRGASDTTPLSLFGLALYRKSANQPEFLNGAAQNALKWMQYRRRRPFPFMGDLRGCSHIAARAALALSSAVV